MDRPWTRQEFASLLDCLRRHERLQDAVVQHNKQWRTGRSPDSIDTKVRREGMGGYGNFLKFPAQRKTDMPLPDMVKRLIDQLRKKPSCDAAELCNDLDVSPRRLEQLVRAAKDSGHSVEMPTQDRIALNVKAPPIDRLAVHRLPIAPVKDRIRWAVASDIHFASKLHRSECLRDFVDFAYEQGIKEVLVPGDVFAGMNMYHGQLNEVTGWGVQNQLPEAVKGLPQRQGLTYHMIGGNHDESFMKASGSNIIQALAKARPDVKDYGFYSALLDLAAPEAKKAIKVELHHPDKAGAYAITYHIQKEIEQMPAGMKPQILFMGHTHQSVLMPDYRSVAAFYCGTFEDQTLYLKRKHIAPHIGGWLVDAGITADGSLKTLSTTWVRYFHSRRGPLRMQDQFEPSNEVRMERVVGLPVD